MPSRWEHLLESKPIPLVDHLLEEVAKLLEKDLRQWPLPVTELDPETGAGFTALLQSDSVRPRPEVFEAAFQVARWELERALDASAEYFRNQRWREHNLPDDARQSILFISRWLVEQLLSVREYTHSRVTRPQLIDCLGRLERRFRATWGDSRA